MSLIGITLGVGLLGLAGIYGLRSIWLLPMQKKRQQWTYNILLVLGAIPMAIFLSFIVANVNDDWFTWLFLVSGSILLMVAIGLLFEINYLSKNRPENVSDEP